MTQTKSCVLAIVAAVVLVAAFASSARADFTVSPGVGVFMFSEGPMGSAGNSVLLYTYSGPDTIIGSSTFINGVFFSDGASLLQESAWNVQNTRFPGTSGADFRVATIIAATSGTISIPFSWTTGAGMILRSGDVLRFETFESLDNVAGVDAVWNNPSWTFTDALVTSLGDIASVGSITTSGGLLPLGTNTKIGLYATDGTLIASNDDFGGTAGSGLTGLSLAVGSYYLAVIPYDLAVFPFDAGYAGDFADGVLSPGENALGEYSLSINGLLMASSTLATRETEWYSFSVSVPEPATLTLLQFAAAGWCLRRRRAA